MKAFRYYKDQLPKYFETLPEFQQTTLPPIAERFKVKEGKGYSSSEVSDLSEREEGIVHGMKQKRYSKSIKPVLKQPGKHYVEAVKRHFQRERDTMALSAKQWN